MDHLSPALFDFLGDLERHNDKAWLDAHRERYQGHRREVIQFTAQLYDALAAVDVMPYLEPKKSVARINNNRKFHPQKPPYKDHFGIKIDRGPDKVGLYLHIHPREGFFGGGIHRPSRAMLEAVRRRIDQQGQDLVAAQARPGFQKRLGAIEGESLKVAPRDYSRDHPWIDWLRLKDFTFTRSLSQEDFCSPGLLEELSADFQAALPFLEFLDRARAELAASADE